MKKTLLENALTAARGAYDASPTLQHFARWPDDLRYQEKEAQIIPAVRQIKRWSNPHPLHTATQDISTYGNWKRTYTEEEVGFGFLQDYGYIELYGPDGHYHSLQGRAYIAYWGRGLYYPWHHHEAEEIYLVISGSSYFESEGQDPALLTSGQTRRHYSNQLHSLTLRQEPILALVLWRGDGMDGLPLMGAN
ncbi:dimethylsulfonioproprionate lyase family protein [Planktomarina temperata]|nr:dimethylsulfonioproprionate lyase family protein [Planktomarina temperata]